GAPGPGDKKEVTVTIDFDNIGQRVLALPIPAKNYVDMLSGKSGVLFLLEANAEGRFGDGAATLMKFELDKREIEKVLDGISSLDISANGEKMAYRHGPALFVVPTSGPITPGQGLLKLDEMEVRVDPRQEWAQMYHEVWRIERDFLYDPGLHGLD